MRMAVKKKIGALLICLLVFGLIGCAKDTGKEPVDSNAVLDDNTGDAVQDETPAEEAPEEEAPAEEAPAEETPADAEAEPEEEPEAVVKEKNAKDVIKFAENDLLEGLVVEDGSDEDGGQTVGGVNNGDYIAFYQVNFGNGGFSKASFRAASWYEEGGDVEIRIGGVEGQLVGTCHIPGTGDWSIWQTFDFEVADLASIEGVQDVYMVFTNGGEWLFNLNWFQFAKGPHDAAAVIEAEDYTDGFDLVVEANSDTEGAMGIGGINNGDYTAYHINFGDGGYNKVTFRVASWYMEGGEVEIRLGGIDGDLVGVCKVPGTGDWNIWDSVTCEVEGLASLTGEQLVYLVYTNGGDWLFNMNWFQFEK